MDPNVGIPAKAQNMLVMLRVRMALAIEEGIRSDDLSAGIKRPKLRSEGWDTWCEDEIARYEAMHPIGSQARLALALALIYGSEGRRFDPNRMAACSQWSD
jgi:hypothetical protein